MGEGLILAGLESLTRNKSSNERAYFSDSHFLISYRYLLKSTTQVLSRASESGPARIFPDLEI